MNIFFKELKSYRKNLFWWSVGMVFLMGAGMAKYGTFQSTGQSINDLMKQFPKSIQTIFGMTGFDLSAVSGYFGVMFFYVALMAAVHAVLLGADLLSKEERDRTSEFLFSKPISRPKVITGKLAAGLVCLVVFNIVTLISSIYFVDYYNKGADFTGDIIVLMAGLFFLQLIFFFVGTIIAASHKKPKTSSSIAASILLATFILSVLININEKFDNLKYLTPFKYFDAKIIMADGRLDLVYVIISLALITSMIILTYRNYTNRDLSI